MIGRKNRFWPCLGLLAVASAALAAPLSPQDAERRIRELEQKMALLEQRIAKLESIVLAARHDVEQPAAASPDKWKDRANWRRLRKGMSKKDVELILGPPPKTVPNAYYGDIWYYPDQQGGNVSFNKDEVVTSWGEI
jgi:hypothetical protein